MNKTGLTHVDQRNNPGMVDVSEKKLTKRTAAARSIVVLDESIAALFKGDDIISKKGPVFQTAIIAGTMAAKKTGDLIPMCHPIGMESCEIDIQLKGIEVTILCTCSLVAKTGVEMEALTGASVAALTIYDMCKAMSHDIIIQNTRLVSKTGGKKDFHIDE